MTPPREKHYTGINSAGSLLLAVVLLFWIACADRRRADNSGDAKANARSGLSYLAVIKIQPVPRQKSLEVEMPWQGRRSTLHTGHQTANMNMYLCAQDLMC